jgi:hypothetical protein
VCSCVDAIITAADCPFTCGRPQGMDHTSQKTRWHSARVLLPSPRQGETTVVTETRPYSDIIAKVDAAQGE